MNKSTRATAAAAAAATAAGGCLHSNFLGHIWRRLLKEKSPRQPSNLHTNPKP